jgi:hypothetical protein
MLVMGVCNPAGEKHGYNGLYFTDSELRDLVCTGALRNVPVKAEHRGEQLGSVVSGFVDEAGRLNCVMRITDNTVEGTIAKGLVKDGIARELSLGYSVDVANSENKLVAHAKKVLEISLVRKGARDACYVTAFEEEGKHTHWCLDSEKPNPGENPWDDFNML